eukprot:6492008-Amphidinium_carterae.1
MIQTRFFSGLESSDVKVFVLASSQRCCSTSTQERIQEPPAMWGQLGGAIEDDNGDLHLPGLPASPHDADDDDEDGPDEDDYGARGRGKRACLQPRDVDSDFPESDSDESQRRQDANDTVADAVGGGEEHMQLDEAAPNVLAEPDRSPALLNKGLPPLAVTDSETLRGIASAPLGGAHEETTLCATTGAARARDARAAHPRSHDWGIFHFNFSESRQDPGRFQWECTCRLHKRNDKTGCKKSRRLQRDAPLEQEADRVLRALKAWAISGPEYKYQRTHLQRPVSVEEAPSDEFLDARCITVAPTQVLTDEAMENELPKVPAPNPEAASTTKGGETLLRGRGRGARPKQKGRGRGKARQPSLFGIFLRNFNF